MSRGGDVEGLPGDALRTLAVREAVTAVTAIPMILEAAARQAVGGTLPHLEEGVGVGKEDLYLQDQVLILGIEGIAVGQRGGNGNKAGNAGVGVQLDVIQQGNPAEVSVLTQQGLQVQGVGVHLVVPLGSKLGLQLLLGIAVEIIDLGIAAEVQDHQAVAGAVEFLEGRVAAEVQCAQLVVGAAHGAQEGEAGDVQFGELVAVAVEPLQVLKVLDTCQRADAQVRDTQELAAADGLPLRVGDDVGILRALPGKYQDGVRHIGAEGVVRENGGEGGIRGEQDPGKDLAAVAAGGLGPAGGVLRGLDEDGL